MNKIKLLFTCFGGSNVKSLIGCSKQSIHFNYSVIGVENGLAGNVNIF